MIKCKEIFKLKRMLEKSGIPFDWIPNWGYSTDDVEDIRKVSPDLVEHYQICYPSQSKDQWISVIGGFGVYGEKEDRLEIMGGLTPWEKFNDDEGDEIIGHLTAHNVYKRIENHYIENLLRERGYEK